MAFGLSVQVSLLLCGCVCVCVFACISVCGAQRSNVLTRRPYKRACLNMCVCVNVGILRIEPVKNILAWR